MAIATVNPATGQTERSFEPHTDAEVERRIANASADFEELRGTTFTDRAGWMRAAADLVEVDDIARIMTTEMGKTLVAAKAEAAKCATAMRFYAEHAEEFLADVPADADAVGAKSAYVTYQPLGVVLAVMPWNFPLWQVVRFAAPALMAGNAGLLKHASNVPQTALYLGDLFKRAGFPAGAFQTVLVGSDKVAKIIADDRVRAATLTGSEAAGRALAAEAGKHLKKTVLELGGSDPYVVMPSADIARAAEVAATARCQNNGQSCIAAKRFIVHTAVYDEFADHFVKAMSELTVGDPMLESTDVGPLATEQGRSDVAELVADAVSYGAQVPVGGEVPARDGWWYPPTVITGVTDEMRMFEEEVFGPVAALYRVDSCDEAIALANVTSFGLGANAWTSDTDERDRFVRELEAGLVFVNGMVASHPHLPFGGVKNSGYGRELSAVGIKEFCNTKAVWLGPER
jgi:succinate-semialdehyde dehydrogenase/glutarate-semialdehyde dehydrogenase